MITKGGGGRGTLKMYICAVLCMKHNISVVLFYMCSLCCYINIDILLEQVPQLPLALNSIIMRKFSNRYM